MNTYFQCIVFVFGQEVSCDVTEYMAVCIV